MIKLLIADDEPLVLVGMQSMLNWAELGIEVCGTAHNGQKALELIEQHRPEIVITDIKMPLINGLELAERCRTQFGELPVFILLTSFEDFSFAKQAMHLGALEYLIKLELTPQGLHNTIQSAIKRVDRIRNALPAGSAAQAGEGSLRVFQEKFFARLYNNLFESSEQFWRQKEDLGLKFDSEAYCVVACAIEGIKEMPVPQQITLCTSTVNMVQDTLEKFGLCYVTTLDMRHFNVLFCLSAKEAADANHLPDMVKTAANTVKRYFNVQLLCGIGKAVYEPVALAESAHSARCVLPLASREQPTVVFSGTAARELFDFSTYRAQLIKAFEELDTGALHDTIAQIVAHLTGHPSRHVQAMDAASGLLYMALTLLPEGEQTVSAIFDDDPDSYRVLYKYTSTAQCCTWMERLGDGLCQTLRSQHKNYKRRVVEEVQVYIQKNVAKKLSLNEVAAAFSFSPNYLSQLFAKYAQHGFIETITMEKISAAKRMMRQEDLKVYEVAERLGYDSAFYFSKVFKKETGQTPRDYMQNSAR